MSLSRQPFYTPKAKPARPLFTPVISEEEFRALHWTAQLELRPLRNQYRRAWPEGDYNTQIDNWDAEEYDNEKEGTQ